MSDYFDDTLADNVYNLISKMDDDSAEMFTRVLADEIYEDLVSKNQKLIARENRKIVAKALDTAERVSKSLIAQGRQDEAIAVAYAARAGVQDEIEIIKSGKEPGWNKGKDGRFTTPDRVHHGSWGKDQPRHAPRRVSAVTPAASKVKPVKPVKLQKPITVPKDEWTPKDWTPGDKSKLKIKPDKATVRSGDFLPKQERWEDGEEVRGKNGKVKGNVGDEGMPSAGDMKGPALAGDKYYAGTGRFVQAQQDAARYAVDATNAVRRPLHNMRANEEAMWGHISPGGFDGAKAAGRTLESTFNQDRDWTPSEAAERSNLDRTWNSMQSAGSLASGIGQAGTAVGVPYAQSLTYAGEAAKVAGKLGPGGERIVGPSVRRAQYRYQGVERKQDKELKAEVTQAMKRVLNEKMHRMPKNRRDEVSGKLFNGTVQPGDFLTARDRADASREAATNFLRERLPDARRNPLREGSGKIAPSEGIIVGADGNVKHQTVGVAEDHYLPFKHSNLKAMKGGAYVRTRTLGGLTTEDIRTGLMTGVNSMIVVSHSGVFQVDFDPEFTKRNTNRAKAMVDRYGKILDAVQSEKVTKTPLSRMERAEIEEQVDEWAQRQIGGAKPEEIRQKYKELQEEAMTRPRLTKEEQEKIQRFARQGYSQAELQTEKAQRDVRVAERSLAIAALQAKGERHYALNGNGYKAALETLQDEFPYFIKVNAIVDADDVFGHLGMQNTDSGYVKPRFLHPEKEQHGYFGENIDSARGNAGSKRRGDTTQWQNYRYNKNQKFLTPVEERRENQNQDQGRNTNLRERENAQIDAQRLKANTPPQAMANINAIASDTFKRANAQIKVQPQLKDSIERLLPRIRKWEDTSETGKIALLSNSEFTSGLLSDLEDASTVIPGISGSGIAALKQSLGGTYTRNIKVMGVPSPVIPMEFKSDDRITLRDNEAIRDNVLKLKQKYSSGYSSNHDAELREMSNRERQREGNRSANVLAIELARYELQNKLDAGDDLGTSVADEASEYLRQRSTAE